MEKLETYNKNVKNLKIDALIRYQMENKKILKFSVTFQSLFGHLFEMSSHFFHFLQPKTEWTPCDSTRAQKIDQIGMYIACGLEKDDNVTEGSIFRTEFVNDGKNFGVELSFQR